MEFYKSEGVWLKGNLHLHSTNSDGAKSVRELAELYKSLGYDFIVVTDHDRVSEIPAGIKDIVVIRGLELGVGLVHAVGVGAQGTPEKKMERWQDIYDISGKSGFSFLCHPYWSNLDLSHFLALREFSAVEVYNTGCEMENGRGFAEYPWDNALAAGIRMNAVAVDDSHQRIADYGGGWVMVKAARREEGEIIAALRQGCYFSSMGPQIRDIVMDGATVRVESSPCRRIRFIADCWYGAVCGAEPGRHISAAAYKLDGKEKYLRVECVDEGGNKAWSNPLYLSPR